MPFIFNFKMFFHRFMVLVLTSTMVSSCDYLDSSSSSSSSVEESSSESKCACGNPCSNSVEVDGDYSVTKEPNFYQTPPDLTSLTMADGLPYNCLQLAYGVSSDVSDTVPEREDTVYTVFTDSKKNWYEAFADCRKRGLDLATIENEREYMELYNKIEHIVKGRFFLSATDLARQGTFVWTSTGEDVRYHKWYWNDKNAQPDNYVYNGEVEHCMELSYNNDYKMNDYFCNQPLNYVCDDRNLKKPKDSERCNKVFTVNTGNKLNWYEALIDCKRQGLRLATVESQEEQEEVISLIKLQDLPIRRVSVFWLSGLYLGRQNNYVWMTSGQPLNYTVWYKEPNHGVLGGGKEHCLSLRSDFGYKWKDVICTSRNYYVCDNQT